MKTKLLLLIFSATVIGSGTISTSENITDEDEALVKKIAQNNVIFPTIDQIKDITGLCALPVIPLHLAYAVQGQGITKTLAHMLGYASIPLYLIIKDKSKPGFKRILDYIARIEKTSTLKSFQYSSISILYLVGMLLTKAPLATLLTKTTKTLSNDYLQALLQILLKPIKSLEASGPVQLFMIMKCLEAGALYGLKPFLAFYKSYCNDMFGWYKMAHAYNQNPANNN